MSVTDDWCLTACLAPLSVDLSVTRLSPPVMSSTVAVEVSSVVPSTPVVATSAASPSFTDFFASSTSSSEVSSSPASSAGDSTASMASDVVSNETPTQVAFRLRRSIATASNQIEAILARLSDEIEEGTSDW